MTRKEFLTVSSALAATGRVFGESRPPSTAAKARGDARPAEPRNRQPYQGVDWTTAHQIRGTTHVHCTTQADLDEILKRIEFITLSNYYPSAP